LEAIMREASEQSQRSKLPHLEAGCDFETMLQSTQDRSLRLIAWEGTALVRMVDIETIRSLNEHEQKSIALAVGPEGGFSAEEVDLAEKYGYQQISLGNRILRTETACIAGTAILRNLSDSLFG
jgi:16S rRNA (uracil1498-N3)-methyltransferase